MRNRIAMSLAAAIGLLGPGPAYGEGVDLKLEVPAGDAAASPQTVKVSHGDSVTITWTAHRAVELHLHGYDVSVRVGAAAPEAMRFEASIPGRFPVEAHTAGGSHSIVLYVEVHPR